MITLTGVTHDDRYRLRVDVPMKPLWVTALASALDVIEARHPMLDASERLARVIAAGCCAIANEDANRSTAQ